MEIDIIKRVVADQRQEMESLMQGGMVERELLPRAQQQLGHPNILAILGVRRCGKSVFSWLLAKTLKENFAYLNFDDERLIGLRTEDLDKVIQAFQELYGDVTLVVLDEIQNVPGWELFASRIRRTRKVIITGSSSMLLSGELATHLTGRYLDLALFPFSFREAVGFMPDAYLTADRARARAALEDYIAGSGFPEFRGFGPAIVARTFGDILVRDCIQRHGIRHAETFRELARYLVSNFSCEFTYSKLSKLFRLRDQHTARNYVGHLREAFLIVVLERYSPKLKQQGLAPKKVYAIDHGLCNVVGFRLSKDRGRLFENIVCIDLLRRRETDTEIYYWKDAQQNEVDFIVRRGRKVAQLIQVCCEPGEPAVWEREMKALLKAAEELGCADLLVITAEHDAVEQVRWHDLSRKVRFVPLWRWLLEKA